MTVIAYHAIFTTYGTWLPNDPRGSYSRKIYSEEFAVLGDVKYGRQYPQPPSEELRRFRIAALPQLKRPPFYIDSAKRAIVAEAFASVVERLSLVIHACAIMSNHVHIVVRRATHHRIEYLVGQLKAAATKQMGLSETPWTRGAGWKVFIDDEDVVQVAVDYVERNPVVAGIKPQVYNFVTPLGDWIESEECMRLAGRRADDR